MSKYGVFSGPYFPVFGLNKERYSVSLRIQSECGKIRTRRNSVFRHFLRSERPDIQGEWFKASTKVMKRLCMMLVLAPMDHILNQIFKMKYEMDVYGIEFEIENDFRK